MTNNASRNNAQQSNRRLSWLGGRAAVCALLLVLGLPYSTPAQETVKANPVKVEAAFLRNFARYVTWPSHAFASGSSPWRVCILGGDPFGAILANTFQGRTEQGRSFEFFWAESIDHLPPCHIVFMAYKDSTKRRAALAALAKRPVLTVGDTPGFLQEGGIVGFHVSDRVEISVNLDQARSASLKIQTKMLEVSREVVENGAVRRLR
ncbi:MAG: YfiR family protein [Pelobacteraceae bacterium]